MDKTTKELIPLESAKVLEIFSDMKAWETIYEQIKNHVDVVVPDLSKKKNRDSVVSLAAWVTSSKTYLDKERKKLTADARKQIKDVNEMWKVIESKLTALSRKTREPVTLWEKEEKRKKDREDARVDKIQGKIMEIAAYNPQNDEGDYILPEQATAEQLKKAIEALENLAINMIFYQEFLEEAEKTKIKRLEELGSVYKFRKEQEALEAEKRKLADKNAEIEKKAREQERIEEKRKTAIQSRIDMIKAYDCSNIKWENASAIQHRIKNLEGIIIDESFEDRETEAALLKDKLLEKLQVGLPLAVEADKKAAEELSLKLKAEAEERVEKARLEKEEKARLEKEKREADIEHRRTINRAVLSCLKEAGFNEIQAVKILKLIVADKIDHVTINY